jgi:RNA recognition motif-containing protein
MGDERGTRVYVGNLTDKVKKEQLEEEFTRFGKLNSVWIAHNPPGEFSKGFFTEIDSNKLDFSS